jgi:predicted DNA-binding transcriptional regulator YafY
LGYFFGSINNYIVNSSKGISAVILAQWISVSQPTAWRMGHAIREMMIPTSESITLTGIVELDEKYFGGKPRYQPGVIHFNFNIRPDWKEKFNE